MSGDPRQVFAVGIADYVETHNRYEALTKREAVIAAVRVLTDDPTAAREFIRIVGLPVPSGASTPKEET